MVFVCDICGYEYNPDAGDPDNGVEPGTALQTYRMIGFAHYAVQKKEIS